MFSQPMESKEFIPIVQGKMDLVLEGKGYE